MLQTKMDFTKPDSKKVADLLGTQLLMLDEVFTLGGRMGVVMLSETKKGSCEFTHEVSMIDTDCWHRIVELLSMAQQTRRPGSHPKDEFGDVHVILFGPGPAALKCISCPSAHADVNLHSCATLARRLQAIAAARISEHCMLWALRS